MALPAPSAGVETPVYSTHPGTIAKELLSLKYLFEPGGNIKVFGDHLAQRFKNKGETAHNILTALSSGQWENVQKIFDRADIKNDSELRGRRASFIVQILENPDNYPYFSYLVQTRGEHAYRGYLVKALLADVAHWREEEYRCEVLGNVQKKSLCRQRVDKLEDLFNKLTETQSSSPSAPAPNQ